MGRTLMASGLALAALVLGACGDDADAGEPCKEGMLAGQYIGCMCDEKMGAQVCGEDGRLSECDCTAGDGGFVLPTGGTGGITTETGGTGGVGGATGGAGGVGGVGGSDDDGGVPADSGPGDVVGPPSDGSMLSTCDPAGGASACNDGLVCYSAGGVFAVGYCTPSCTMATADTDCTDGATCSNGACRFSCMDADDTSCPMFMECMMVIGPTFRCGYPEDVSLPPGDVPLYGVCSSQTDCAEGLRCNNYGHCTHDCETEADCEAATTGDLVVGCSPNTMFMGGQSIPGNGCRFECDPTSDPDLCPEGLSCTPAGLGMFRCTSL